MGLNGKKGGDSRSQRNDRLTRRATEDRFCWIKERNSKEKPQTKTKKMYFLRTEALLRRREPFKEKDSKKIVKPKSSLYKKMYFLRTEALIATKGALFQERIQREAQTEFGFDMRASKGRFMAKRMSERLSLSLNSFLKKGGGAKSQEIFSLVSALILHSLRKQKGQHKNN